MIKYASFLFLIISITCARAEVTSVTPADAKAGEIKAAKVFYVGEVSERKVAELISVLDRLNSDNKALANIYLYINSPGGDVDSAQTAYWAIKSSRIPVTAVNVSTVASVATVMFCGAKVRTAFPGTVFVLKPANITLPAMSIQPIQYVLSRELLKSYNDVFASVYRECTNLPAEEVSTIVESADDRLLMNAGEALEKGVISGETREIVDTPLSYTIVDKDGLSLNVMVGYKD